MSGTRVNDFDHDPLAAPIEWLASAGEKPAVRTVYAAAHVVVRAEYQGTSHRHDAPGTPTELSEVIDHEATLGIRRHLDRYGFGVAEAMDTAQRFAIGWKNARVLIESCGAAKLEHGFIAGAGSDQLETVPSASALVDAIVEQVEFVQTHGGMAILLPQIWLIEEGYDEEQTVAFYDAIIRQVKGPIAVHWLGEMFHPGLAGYFPGDSFRRVMALNPEVVRGCKLSLLDAEFERKIRRELLERDQMVLTGDDFHFGALIAGEPNAAVERWSDLDGRPLALGLFSHGLLGIFDAIARPASVALQLLAHGERAQYTEIMERCERLGQAVFEAPTEHYKAGLAFLAWLAGLQDQPLLLNREDQQRSAEHYRTIARLAASAGVFENRTLAMERLAGC